MDLSNTHDGAYHIITVNAPRIDAAAAIAFKEALRSATADGSEDVLLDLGQVQFIDSSGLGAIVAGLKLVGPARRLDLACLTPDVKKVFRLTRMNTIFAIHDDIASASPRRAG
ncbi:STAS domain-containing protein [Roseovarius sp. Pro17]|uniref:STAS domain-containing protein n=1 Tax=Roseovarius sp. Pro17 TaxID=3108175 RepID=UPI002D76EA89|nr:STAS domain-containing protein [Roseovarius sp. Pro17]